jgi:GTPase SAR1 family protein
MWQGKVRDENKDLPIIVAINKTDMREEAAMTMDAIREVRGSSSTSWGRRV